MPADEAERTVNLFRNGLAGTPEQIVERLRSLESLGMTYAITYFVDSVLDPKAVELFATRVIPELGVA